ncbi:MAG: ABC transporter ATP-binding protein [Planctomycetota bacterium]
MKPLLQVENLKVWFPKATTFFGTPISWIKAVDDVCFELKHGETIGLVGESGSGKSTTGYSILRSLTPRSGRMLFSPDGEKQHDLAQLNQKQLRPLRKHMQLIFQDPFSSLNPRMTVLQLVSEPLIVNGITNKGELRDRVRGLIVEAGLKADFLNRYPHAFSGGQRQRIVIARALALSPKLVVADEAVSALDVSVQAQILNLLLDLREKHGLSYIFIAHNLEVVRHISNRVAVMYAGRLVEDGPTEEVFGNPKHPYTQALLASSPKPDPTSTRKARQLPGEVPDPSNLPSGCVFHPRCPSRMPECSVRVPVTTKVGDSNVRCLLHETSSTPTAAPMYPEPFAEKSP